MVEAINEESREKKEWYVHFIRVFSGYIYLLLITFVSWSLAVIKLGIQKGA